MELIDNQPDVPENAHRWLPKAVRSTQLLSRDIYLKNLYIWSVLGSLAEVEDPIQPRAQKKNHIGIP
jgi:hypothetical protein